MDDGGREPNVDEALVERGIGAAAEYLRRLGWTNVTVAELGTPPRITGDDAGDAVTVYVEVSDRPTSSCGSVQHQPDPGTSRTDVISILVIGENRALLRHHRAID